MNKNQKSIIGAYEKGYRVNEEGRVTSSIGNELEMKIKKGVRYPRISVNLPEINAKYSISITVHQLAAYCFYKEEMFKEDIVVRHLDGDVFNVSKNNIKLGTQMDNMQDKKYKTEKTVKNIEDENKKEIVRKKNLYKIEKKYIKCLEELKSKEMSQSNKLILYAYEKGYRVTKKGEFLNPKGEELKIKIRDKKRKYAYPKFTINCYDLLGKKASFPIHRFAAFCFYGKDLFEEGIEVRHLKPDVLDVSKSNIVLGTKSQNELDKDKKTIKKRKINAAQAAREKLRSLNDVQVHEIRELLKTKNYSHKEIGKMYNVGSHTITKISLGKTYQEIK